MCNTSLFETQFFYWAECVLKSPESIRLTLFKGLVENCSAEYTACTFTWIPRFSHYAEEVALHPYTTIWEQIDGFGRK